uniref:Uncharacterized protein n=1 Tax=Kalanchoe fedtschenkoi TaxID=63787 RepID=A0A7N0T1L6_KALFE
MLILRNMAACPDGRAAMLDAGAVGLLVSVLGESNSDSMSTQERCISVLYGLSHGGLRFKILAKEAGAVRKLEEFSGSERAENTVRGIMEAVMDTREENIEEDVDWEELIDLELANRGQSCSAGSSNF